MADIANGWETGKLPAMKVEFVVRRWSLLPEFGSPPGDCDKSGHIAGCHSPYILVHILPTVKYVDISVCNYAMNSSDHSFFVISAFFWS